MPQSDSPDSPHCKVSIRSLGQLPIRVRGANAGWHFFMGKLADLGETVNPLDL
jgi:hypothetical protein